MDPRASPAAAAPGGIPRARGDGPQGEPAAARRRRGFPALAGMDPPRAAHPVRRLWIPRARGDGPYGPGLVIEYSADSPRSRGWTPLAGQLLGPRPGFPALAGMDPGPCASTARAARIPRARGDGPCRGPAAASDGMDSPRSRGWTPLAGQLLGPRPGFPALAGMDRERPGGDSGHGRIPRARGDGPAAYVRRVFAAEDSPRSRGWTRRHPAGDVVERGFPALAGMDLRRADRPSPPARIPRARGDGPPDAPGHARAPGDSPRSRGWTLAVSAGMDLRWAVAETDSSWIPRARGDGPRRRRQPRQPAPDSPRSRGWTPGRVAGDRHQHGFPALAGMDPARPRPTAGPGRIPRARGDGPLVSWLRTLRRQDSPRSRGWTSGLERRPRRGDGFPALAGMDPARTGRPAAARGIPRARGDGPLRPGRGVGVVRDSPRSRGWTRHRCLQHFAQVGFPALAGMDPESDLPGRERGWIPRARGDGPDGGEPDRERRQDSPRSRGWTHDVDALLARLDGFPALAGMDPATIGPSSSRRRIPRARGDGPSPSSSRSDANTDSPRSRGWTQRPQPIERHVSGFPALAGMDRAARGDRRSGAWIPRARGDGPRRSTGPVECHADSPRSRGWTRAPPGRGGSGGGFPALAGMDPSRRARSC